MNVRKKFRALMNGKRLVLMPGAYDGLSARIMEAEGFAAICAGGYAAIGSMLAQADMGQSNVRDYADHYARICGAVEIPVFVDADTGFGGVNNVRQMIRAFEAAGVAGMFFSDQVFPNRCGYLPGKQVVPVEQMLAKIKAALDARRDPDFFIAARTDAAGVEGLDAAIERCQLFVAAGADLAKPQGVDAIEDIKRVIREVDCPHMATLSQAAGPNAEAWKSSEPPASPRRHSRRSHCLRPRMRCAMCCASSSARTHSRPRSSISCRSTTTTRWSASRTNWPARKPMTEPLPRLCANVRPNSRTEQLTQKERAA